MEGKSLIANSVALRTARPEEEELTLIHNALNPLLSPHSQDPESVLSWLDKYIVNNPLLDQKGATALRVAVATFYDVDKEPTEGLDEGKRISLAEALAHAGIQAKRERLYALFEKIGPVVRATQEAIREIEQ